MDETYIESYIMWVYDHMLTIVHLFDELSEYIDYIVEF